MSNSSQVNSRRRITTYNVVIPFLVQEYLYMAETVNQALGDKSRVLYHVGLRQRQWTSVVKGCDNKRHCVTLDNITTRVNVVRSLSDPLS